MKAAAGGNDDAIGAAAIALGVATLGTPLLAWPLYFAISGQSLSVHGSSSPEGLATLIMIFFVSIIVTFFGLIFCALPLTALGNRISGGRIWVVATINLAVAAVPCWSSLLEGGTSGLMVGLFIGFAATLFVSVYIVNIRRGTRERAGG